MTLRTCPYEQKTNMWLWKKKSKLSCGMFVSLLNHMVSIRVPCVIWSHWYQNICYFRVDPNIPIRSSFCVTFNLWSFFLNLNFCIIKLEYSFVKSLHHSLNFHWDFPPAMNILGSVGGHFPVKHPFIRETLTPLHRDRGCRQPFPLVDIIWKGALGIYCKLLQWCDMSVKEP